MLARGLKAVGRLHDAPAAPGVMPDLADPVTTLGELQWMAVAQQAKPYLCAADMKDIDEAMRSCCKNVMA